MIPGDSFMYDADRINDHIQQNHEYHLWKDTKFESAGNDFTYILMSCFFSYKSKTLSHLRECILRYKDVIRVNTNSSEKQTKMLEALFKIWGHSHIHLQMVLEILFNHYILDYILFFDFTFAFAKERLGKNGTFNSIYVYLDLIDYFIDHSGINMSKLRKCLSEEQANLAQSESTMIQNDILNKLESLEEYIEKLKNTIKSDVEILRDRYDDLIKSCKDLETNRLLGEKFNEFTRKHI
jgi:hypothetical protein